MADMTKIVAATIAIAVRDDAYMMNDLGYIVGKCDCDCNRSCTHHCGLHRHKRRTRRILGPARGRYGPDHRWGAHGRGQAHF